MSVQRRKLAGNNLEQEGSIPEDIRALPCFPGSLEARALQDDCHTLEQPCDMGATGSEESRDMAGSRGHSTKPLKSALTRSLSPNSTRFAAAAAEAERAAGATSSPELGPE